MRKAEESLELFGLNAKNDWMHPNVVIFVMNVEMRDEEAAFWLSEPVIEREKEKRKVASVLRLRVRD